MHYIVRENSFPYSLHFGGFNILYLILRISTFHIAYFAILTGSNELAPRETEHFHIN